MMVTNTTVTSWDLTSRQSHGELRGTWARPGPSTPSAACLITWSDIIVRIETESDENSKGKRWKKYNLVSEIQQCSLWHLVHIREIRLWKSWKIDKIYWAGRTFKWENAQCLSDFNLRSFYSVCQPCRDTCWCSLIWLRPWNRFPLTVNNESQHILCNNNLS